MNLKSSRIPLLIATLLACVLNFGVQRHSDLSDFSKGVAAGVWIGMLLLMVIAQKKAADRKR